MPMVCTQCGTQGDPRTYTKGSMLVELVLWLLFIVPGLFYSVWRLSSRYRGCRACGSPAMVPVDSPRGASLVGR